MQEHQKASVIIPTYGRLEALTNCLEALWKQTDQYFEIVKVTEKGELSKLRNEGARRAKGEHLIFIDDDTIPNPWWFESIMDTFCSDDRIAGVSGPSIITREYRVKRDLFRFKIAKAIYDRVFCEGKHRVPGTISPWGAWTTGACDEGCFYEGEVMYLEACNMAFRKDWFWKVGGFDENYRGVGDFSEPDIAFRIRQAGGRLVFSSSASLYHCPSRSGAFRKRNADSGNRLNNYYLFSERWIKPSWKHSIFKQFLRTYYGITTFKR